MRQLYEFTKACEVKQLGLEQFHSCTTFSPVLVTLEPLYLINSSPFREHIDALLITEGVNSLPWLILAADELEKLQPHLAAGISFSETIEKLRSSTFNQVLEALQKQTERTYKDSFLYSREERLYQLLGVADKLIDV